MLQNIVEFEIDKPDTSSSASFAEDVYKLVTYQNSTTIEYDLLGRHVRVVNITIEGSSVKRCTIPCNLM